MSSEKDCPSVAVEGISSVSARPSDMFNPKRNCSMENICPNEGHWGGDCESRGGAEVHQEQYSLNSSNFPRFYHQFSKTRREGRLTCCFILIFAFFHLTAMSFKGWPSKARSQRSSRIVFRSETVRLYSPSPTATVWRTLMSHRGPVRALSRSRSSRATVSAA